MNCNKQYRQVIFSFVLFAVGIANAQANFDPNDSYSSLLVSYQSSKFADPICINLDCHTGVTGPAVVFSHQLVPNFAVGLAGSYLSSSGQTSSINSTTVSAFAEAVVGLGYRFDVGTSAALLSTTLQLCTSYTSNCSSVSDTGNDLGVFGKVFLARDRSVSLKLGYHAIALKNSADQSVITLSLVAIVARHHRVAISMDRDPKSTGNAFSGGVNLGYSYLVF